MLLSRPKEDSTNLIAGVEIVTLNFAALRGVGVVQILFDLSGPGGTGLINLTTLDIMKQPINLEQLGVLLAKCPMPRLRNLSLSVIVGDARPRITECLKSELKLQEVAVQIFGGLTSCELLLLIQSFGDLGSLSLDDLQICRYWNIGWRRNWESCQTRIPQWTSLQIHHKSELLDLFLGESRSDYELSELTLLTEPGHFFPKRACVSAEDRCNMPSLQCPSTDTVHDDEAPVNFVACSLMTVEDNCLIHPTNLHDLYIHIRPPGTSSSTTVTNSSPSLASSPGNGVHKWKYIEEMPSLARACFLPIIEKCGPNLQSLEVSAELITACCSDVLTTRRLLRLQDKCLNVRKATVIAGGDLVQRQLRPSAKNISTYLSLFPALKEVRIIGIDIFTEGIIQEILTACGHLRRLYTFSLRNLTLDFASLPSHNALELLFMIVKDIVTLPADKGRSTVVMDKAEYCTKLGNLLIDKEAYAPSTVSEFKKLVNSINKTIGKLRKAGALTRREALAAKASDAAMVRFYGLPKDSEWTVKSAEEFLSRIKRLEVEADEVTVSFDVISLFASIPPALAIDTIDGFLREKYDETDQQLKRVHIIQLLELCLKTFFTFKGQIYEQKKGTPMGSPLSGLIAEAVLQRFERLVFSSYPPKFWARYVDDTFVIIKRSDVQTFKALLNSIFSDIQFTMEEELNNQLAFLDVQVTKLEDGKIRTTVYRKTTNTRGILHFKSNHPVGHKRSCVRTLFQRVQTHCSDDNGRKEEIKYLHALFKVNGYPKSFIRKCLKKPRPERSDGENPKFWLAIPYVKNVSEATAGILKSFGIGVAHKPEPTIRQQIMRPKDPLPVTEQSAVVYSIPCQNCDARYVGETGKRLGTRLHEHQLAINRKDKLSMVYGHVKQQNHNFAFEKARIIGRANDKMARLMLESWSSTGTLNRAIDLHPAYRALRTRLESVRTRPSGQSSKVTRGRQPMPAESRREAGRGPCDQHGTPPHRDAHEAEINSHEPQQLISPLGDEG
ncbi:hypothetical protein SprV_0401512100 [Sparganum proliferum]